MGCCIGVSTETVLQLDKFYTIVTKVYELTFQLLVLCQSECQISIHSTKDYSEFETSVHKLFSLWCKTYLFVEHLL